MPPHRSGLKQIYADTLITRQFNASEDVAWWCRRFPLQHLERDGSSTISHGRTIPAARSFERSRTPTWISTAGVVAYADINMFTGRESRAEVNPANSIGSWVWRSAARSESSVYSEEEHRVDRPRSFSHVLR